MSVHDREDALVTRLRQLAPSLDGEPDPEFRAATRARLVAMAAVRTPEPAPASGLQRLVAAPATDGPAARWRSRLTAGLAGAALAVTACAALVAVADGARPGDALYDLKRGTEQTQLALAGDSRGTTLLTFASTRLEELEALAGTGASAADADPDLVLATLRAMDEQTGEGAGWLTGRAVETADGSPLDALGTWAAGQSSGLAALQDLVPDATAGAVEESLGLLDEVAARSDGLRAALSCPGGPSVSGTDDLGPVPVPCPAPESTPPATVGGTPDSPGAPGTGSASPGTGGGTTGATTGTAPEGTASAAPTAPPTTPPSTPRAPGGLPIPPLPTTPPLPTEQGGGLVPGTGGGPSPRPPVVQAPSAPVTICLPPLATLGNC